MLDWLIEDGRVALLAIMVLLAEILLVAIQRRATARFLTNGVAGLALLGAVYCALSGAPAPVMLICLGVGLAAHLAWLRSEINSARRN